MPESVPRFLEKDRELFYAMGASRDGEIRFSLASNAFSCREEIVGGNGCRPSFSEFPHPSVLPNLGAQVLIHLPQVETRGARLEPHK